VAAPAHLFTYGTLVFPEVMTAVAGRSFASVPATLDGFERVCVRGAVYPAARAAIGARITGLLHLDLDAGPLARLDRFEGELYQRQGVCVTRADGTTCAAEAYVVPARSFHRLEPRPWDLDRFRRDHLAAYLARCRAGRVAAEHAG
jgi:gamma-glutamylcyclotransferase (GGCT)/AIG2-like uncharacterized protein YtfP